MTEKRKNIKFLICQIVVAILGLLWIIVRGNTVLLSAYIPIMVIVIPATYFNYTLCKLENKWHSMWHERTPCDGEPSDFRLLMGKISEWILFIMALVLALLSGMIA